MKKKLSLLIATLAATAAFSFTSFAGSWQNDARGFWWQNDDGSYPVNTWQWLDGNQDGISECYYFDGNGYLLTNTVTPDGYLVNADGAWIINGLIQTQGTQANLPAVNPVQENDQTAPAIPAGISSVPYDGYTLVANTHTKKYHYPTCAQVARISPEHLGYASNEADLIASGYDACKKCH